MSAASEYWDSIYNKDGFQSSDRKDFLATVLPRLAKGKALEIGTGSGSDAVFMAQSGFEVHGFDVSPLAVKEAQARAEKAGVQVDIQQKDLDLFLFKMMEYDTIIMNYYRPPLPRYYSELIRTMKQGGTIVIESFLDDEAPEAYGDDEQFKNYYFKPNEVLKNLKGLRILFYHEGIIDGTSPLKDEPRLEVEVMSLSGVRRSRNSKPKMPLALISTRPPSPWSALAMMSLSPRPTKVSVSMVILPPVVVFLALVIILLSSRSRMSREYRLILLSSPPAVSAVMIPLLFRKMELALISTVPAELSG